MKITQFLAIAAFIGAATLSGSVALAATTPVTITASNYKFAPAEITVHVGEPVTLALTSAGGVHAVQSSDLGIPQTLITPGKTTNVTFTPAKAGTYAIHCAIPCGPGHGDMVLKIKVVP